MKTVIMKLELKGANLFYSDFSLLNATCNTLYYLELH